MSFYDDEVVPYDEEAQEEAKGERDALMPLDRNERMRKSMKKGAHPSHFGGDESESEDEDEGGDELAATPKYTHGDVSEKTSLTSFIMQEAQMEAARDTGMAKLENDLLRTDLMLGMLTEGIPIKTIVTKYLVPKSSLGGAFEFGVGMADRKAAVMGKTYTVEVKRVLYLLRDQKTLAWRGPVNEFEGFASPFCRTRSNVSSYELSHMFKPKQSAEKRFIRLTFKCPETAKVKYVPRKIDIMAKDDDEYELLVAGFDLLWRYHSYKLKLLEKDPKYLMRKSVKRPKTMEEKWELLGYVPLVFQSLDPDNNIKNVHIGLGRSKEDLLLIASSMVAMWSVLFMLFGILLKASLDSDETNYVYYAFFYFLVFFFLVVLLGTLLSNTDVEELGLSSTVTVTQANGTMTIQTPDKKAPMSMKAMVFARCRTLYEWTMFVFIEVIIGGPLSLMWVLVMDWIFIPLYAGYKNKKHIQHWKTAKELSFKYKNQSKDYARQGVNRLPTKRGIAKYASDSWDSVQKLGKDSKAAVKKQKLSKTEMRKRQTMNIGVAGLLNEESRERKNRNSYAQVEMKRRKSRRQSSGTMTGAFAPTAGPEARSKSRSPAPSLELREAKAATRETATL